MRSGSRVDAVVANPVRSGRKQPQRFFCGSPGSYFTTIQTRAQAVVTRNGTVLKSPVRKILRLFSDRSENHRE